MPHGVLQRELGVFGATMMGLGSIVGTGVFVSLGIAAGVAGPAVVIALALAACVAACNGLSSAQLAANHPVSGGTYEYGYAYLTPALGFTAGWMFLCAKTASAATAALGFAGYLLNALGVQAQQAILPLALGGVALLTGVVLLGIRQSSRLNIAVVSITLLALATFVLAGVPTARSGGRANFSPFFAATGDGPWRNLQAVLHATALMFVAYTGYGRIATLGEEVREPRRVIPRAIIAALIVALLVYVAVAVVAVSSAGAQAFSEAARGNVAPLGVIARDFGVAGMQAIVTLGAVTAMLGVMLNLILGLSRVVLAMGRRRDLPPALALVSESTQTPWLAVLVCAAVIGGVVLLRDVRTTWSFSAFTVLIYYGLTNLAVLRLPQHQRLYPAWPAWAGLIGCIFLAFWVERRIWLVGLLLIALGLAWHAIARRLRGH